MNRRKRAGVKFVFLAKLSVTCSSPKMDFESFADRPKSCFRRPLFLLRLPSARLFSCRPRSPPAGSRSPSSKRPWRRSGTRAPPRCPSSSGSHRKRSEGKRRPPIQMERALAGACRDTRHFDPCHCVRLRCIAPMFFLAGCDPADYSCRLKSVVVSVILQSMGECKGAFRSSAEACENYMWGNSLRSSTFHIRFRIAFSRKIDGKRFGFN